MYFFLGLLISSSSILLSLFDTCYELSSKAQKPFFILKKSSKCHNIKLPSKKSCWKDLFWFLIARFINMNVFYFTHIGWRVKETFRKKDKKKLTSLSRSVLGETVPSVWVPPSAYGLGRYSRHRAQFLPIRTSQPVNNIYIVDQFV